MKSFAHPASALHRLLLSDEEVVARVKAGESELFEVVMRRYNRRLFRVSQAILNDETEAEDVLQETYVRAFASLEGFEGRARFSTWLTKIAVYESLRRRRKRARFVPATTRDGHTVDSPTRAPSPEHRAGNHELRRTLEWAIQRLSPSYRAVFVLRELEQLDTRETAEALGLSQSVIKVRLHRARKFLKSQIDSRLGAQTRRLYSFHLDRCDRVVRAVFDRLSPG